MDDFLSLLFHELKTPVSVIKGMSEMLFDNVQNLPTQRALLKTIHNNSLNLERVLLALQHLHKEKKDEQISLQKFKEIFSDTKKRARANFKKAKIILKIDSFKTISIAPFLLETILYNILENSIKNNKFQIIFFLSKEGDFLKISATDSFTRNKHSKMQKHLTSANLGFSIIGRIVEKYLGKFEICSSEGSYKYLLLLN